MILTYTAVPGNWSFSPSLVRCFLPITLLSGSKNIAASNNPYDVKLNIYKGKGKYSQDDDGITAFDITQQVIAEYPEKWDITSIKNRKISIKAKIFDLLEI